MSRETDGGGRIARRVGILFARAGTFSLLISYDEVHGLRMGDILLTTSRRSDPIAQRDIFDGVDMIWGKWSTDGRLIPLRVHLADVAACFHALAAVQGVGRGLAGCGVGDQQTITRLCAIAFLHDMGKINAWFQLKVKPGAPPGRKAGHVAEALRLFDPGQL